MRLKIMAAAGVAALCLSMPAHADENNKLTYLSFSKPVQLPGVTLPAGRYRFELADPIESRRVIKVESEDGKQQLAMLLTLQNQVTEPAKDPLVLFGETPEGQPEAVKAWFYPGESTGFEFVYPRGEAIKIAKQSHTGVLSKSGDNIERINERGEKVPDAKR
jgi:hypothetical protein